MRELATASNCNFSRHLIGGRRQGALVYIVLRYISKEKTIAVDYVLRALQAGARGYVRKAASPRELLEAIYEGTSGRTFLSTRLRQKPIFRVLFNPEPLLGRLTDREAEVLQSIGKGNSTASIAQVLGLSVKTVESYQAHIKEKLKLSNAEELVGFAVDLAFYRGMA